MIRSECIKHDSCCYTPCRCSFGIKELFAAANYHSDTREGDVQDALENNRNMARTKLNKIIEEAKESLYKWNGDISITDEITNDYWMDKHTTRPDPVVDEAIETLRKQSAKGFNKYNMSMEDNDGSMDYWLQQAIEEAADLLHYLTKIKRKLQNDG